MVLFNDDILFDLFQAFGHNFITALKKLDTFAAITESFSAMKLLRNGYFIKLELSIFSRLYSFEIFPPFSLAKK